MSTLTAPTSKQQAHALIDPLPDEASWTYRLEVRADIEEALADVKSGRMVGTAKLRRRRSRIRMARPGSLAAAIVAPNRHELDCLQLAYAYEAAIGTASSPRPPARSDTVSTANPTSLVGRRDAQVARILREPVAQAGLR